MAEIEALEDKYKAMNDEELRGQTQVLKDRLNNGETMEQILPDAFAVVREASTRVLGLTHFHVQLIGGIVLHQGRIAEMRTGEGKTLTATTAVYLNALTGNNVHVITVNEYLATYQAEIMGRLYKFLGMTPPEVQPKAKTLAEENKDGKADTIDSIGTAEELTDEQKAQMNTIWSELMWLVSEGYVVACGWTATPAWTTPWPWPSCSPFPSTT